MNEKIKYIPAILSLAAGAVASVIAILSRYDTLQIMIIILVSLLVFYIVGVIVRALCEKNFVIAEEENADGEAEQNSEDEEKGEEAAEGDKTEEGSPDEKKE